MVAREKLSHSARHVLLHGKGRSASWRYDLSFEWRRVMSKERAERKSSASHSPGLSFLNMNVSYSTDHFFGNMQQERLFLSQFLNYTISGLADAPKCVCLFTK